MTVEEGVLAGGFGSAVWETLSDAGIAPRILRVGLPDRYVTHGAPQLLHEEVGFTGERIAERIEAAVAETLSRRVVFRGEDGTSHSGSGGRISVPVGIRSARGASGHGRGASGLYAA